MTKAPLARGLFYFGAFEAKAGQRPMSVYEPRPRRDMTCVARSMNMATWLN